MSGPRVLGPYTLLSELGSGGMGTVHLAEAGEEAIGLAVGQKVAVKIVHPQLVSTPGFFKRFMREAEVGKRIDHDNVVRTLDVDAAEFDGRTVLYLVMEYVEGGTLRNLQSELGSVPEALLREIALQVSAGLSAIHAEGIIHRDLKPENVLITNDQQVRIMDLGVAKLQEASVAITREGQFAGSFLYAAPEQFRSEDVGPAIDLYSMGVMLYELATGSNPFRGDDAASVIHAHLHKSPPRASEVNPDTSEFTAEVMATLLAKKPQERFDSAETLHGLLEEGESSVWWLERATQLKSREQLLPPIQVRRETPLHGREKELAAMGAAWTRALEGEGNTLLIEGEAGIGKTRLIDEFLRSLAGTDTHILYGAYPPSGGLGGLSDAILSKFDSANLADALAPYLTVTPSLIPAFAALIRHESPPSGSEPLRGDALHAVCCHLMQALSAEHPTVWVLDDVDFAPEQSLALLLAMARAVAGHRILFLLTSRGRIPEEQIAHLGRLPNFKRLTLDRLGARDIVELLQSAFGSKSLAEKLGGKIGYKSDGVPFFILEIVRGLQEGGLLKLRSDGTYAEAQAITEIEVPSAVRDLIEARLKGITEEERNLLDVAAVLGFEFDPDIVARVCEIKRVKVLQKLAALERKPGVVKASKTQYRFDHNQIHELIYSALSPALRQEYHALVADEMAEREGVTPETADQAEGETVYFLALHGLQGTEPKKALPYLKPAMAYLRGSFRESAAAHLADLALSGTTLVSGRERVELLLAKAGSVTGQEHRTAAEEAVSLAQELADAEMLARAHTRLGSCLTTMSEYQEAGRQLQLALEWARKAGNVHLEPHQALGSRAWYLGEFEEAKGHFDSALTIARDASDARSALQPTWGVGLCLWNLGRLQESREHLEQLLESARAAGSRTAQGGALVNLGPLYATLGEIEKARQTLQEAGLLARGAGERHVFGFARCREGYVVESQREFEEASRLIEEARNALQEIHHLNGVIECRIALGRIASARGDGARAREELESARSLAQEIGVSGMAAQARVYLAQLQPEDVPGAAAELAEQGTRLDVATRMEVYFALWKASGDRAHLEQAHELLVFAREHAPEECRASMIENVPLHKEILEAFAA